MMLDQCLQELWTQCRESDEVALVQSAQKRAVISYAQVYRWQEELKRTFKGEEWLVVGINLIPFSCEETTAMLLVAQEPHWIYIPIDVELPVHKQLLMLQCAGVHRLVTTGASPLCRYFSSQRKTTVTLPASPFQPVVVINVPFEKERNAAFQWIQRLRAKNDSMVAPLYVLFTSGTTGEPRGVLGTRLGAWTRLTWMWTTYPFSTDKMSERVLRATKLSFVDSVWEILGAFMKRVHLVHVQSPRSEIDDVAPCYLQSVVVDNTARFLHVLCSENVTRFTAVPSVLELLLLQIRDADRPLTYKGLCYILSSGESLRPHVVQQLTNHFPNVTILNLYGSTELSGDVTCMELRAPFSSGEGDLWQQHGLPIAKLDQGGVIGKTTSLLLLPPAFLENTRAVKDETLLQACVWPQRKKRVASDPDKTLVKGLLYVSGSLLSDGYIDDKCNPNAFVTLDAKRWFCTGDTCCVMQGHLFYCGRHDHAVKVHGQRVYLEAVESAVAMALRESINDTQFTSNHQIIAFAITTEKSKKGALTQQRLVACIMGGDMKRTSIARYTHTRTVNAWIAAHFGTPHTPHAIYLLSPDAVPYLPNGKVDRKALERNFKVECSQVVTSWSNSKPQNSMEERIAQIVTNVLGVALPVGADTKIRAQTFAELGGNSLLATLFVHELDRAFGERLLSRQELLNMTIGDILAVQIKPYLHEETLKLKYCAEKRSNVAFKRQKKNHETLENANADFTCNDRSLTFISRCNQSSMGVKGIYLPTCSLSPESVATKESFSSISWELNQAWRVDLGKCIDASPLVVQRYDSKHTICSTWAIIGSHSRQLVCVDVLTAGREIWRVTLDDRIEASATLSLDHAIVYVGTYMGSLYALDLQSGKTWWTVQAKGAIKASALVLDAQNLVLFGAYDHNLYALDAVLGQLHWVIDLQGSLFSPPFYCDWTKQLFVASTNGNIECLTSPLSDDFKSFEKQWNLQLPGPVFAGLNADSESNMLLVGCADGNLYGIHMTTGKISWHLSTDKPIFSSPCVYQPGFAVFGSHDGKLRKVNARTGELVWATSLKGAVFSSPMVVRLVTSSSKLSDTSKNNDALVYCVATTAGLLCFGDEKTGSIVYQTDHSSGRACNSVHRGESHEDLGPLFGSPVIVENVCLLGTRSNYFYGFQLKSSCLLDG